MYVGDDGQVLAASRNRWITPDDDNFGFAAWVAEHEDELRELGPGRHYGEWYGRGIQRNYGLDERRFALFNTKRWGEERPACCDVVPVLSHEPMFEIKYVTLVINTLSALGSYLVKGFMKPEGVVVLHVASNRTFKVTIGNDGRKGA